MAAMGELPLCDTELVCQISLYHLLSLSLLSELEVGSPVEAALARGAAALGAGAGVVAIWPASAGAGGAASA